MLNFSLLRNFGRNESVGTAYYLPLTQEHGGGPTVASIAEGTNYTGGKLYVRDDGVVVFIANELSK